MKSLLVLWSCLGKSLLILIFFSAVSCGEPNESESKGKSDISDTHMLSHPEIVVGEVVTPLDNAPQQFSEDYLLGKINPAKDSAFVKVSLVYGSKEGMYLRSQTYEAFQKMHEAAKQEGVDLKIISATRTFNDQKAIWESKWTGKRLVNGKDISKMPAKEKALAILRYSSMPGSSRHHWGTDMDLNDLNNSYFESGKGLKIYQWLVGNAANYGFCQPYTAKGSDRPEGYEEEKWHWSYTPLSAPMLSDYKLKIGNEKIKGFAGSETAIELDIVKNYVSGINTGCK